jgi:hypothetical protein
MKKRKGKRIGGPNAALLTAVVLQLFREVSFCLVHCLERVTGGVLRSTSILRTPGPLPSYVDGKVDRSMVIRRTVFSALPKGLILFVTLTL